MYTPMLYVRSNLAHILLKNMLVVTTSHIYACSTYRSQLSVETTTVVAHTLASVVGATVVAHTIVSVVGATVVAHGRHMQSARCESRKMEANPH